MILWEPVPGVCQPEDWEECKRTMKMVNVTSPNIHEAASFLAQEIDEEEDFTRFKVRVEQLAEIFAKEIVDGGAVVFRCGKNGCLVVTQGMRMKWFPAYHTMREKVKDPTGGGNAFCGGFCAGYIFERGDFMEAAKYGNVAASFVIEQFGLPRLEYGLSGRKEVWNGDTVMHRRHIYHHYVENLRYGES
jgi:sugar/nucleoside kinase (ribokinase family)